MDITVPNIASCETKSDLNPVFDAKLKFSCAPALFFNRQKQWFPFSLEWTVKGRDTYY